MPVALDIEGIPYYSASELLKELGISRQTLWRWRRHGSIPQGNLFRGRTLVFTETEADEIRQFANRIEPITNAEKYQLALFEG